MGWLVRCICPLMTQSGHEILSVLISVPPAQL